MGERTRVPERSVSRLVDYWPWWLAFGVMPVLLGMVRRTYHGNDDTIIAEMFASGNIAPFINPGFSTAIRFLYRSISDSVPWYGLILYMLMFWASGWCLWLVHQVFTMRRGGGNTPGYVVHRGVFVVAVGLMFAATFCHFTHITYSMPSIVGSGIAFVAFAFVHGFGIATPKRCFHLGALLAGAYALRPFAVGAAAAALFPLGAAFVFWVVANRRRSIKRQLMFFLSPVVVVLSLGLMAQASLSEEDAAYQDYNFVRGMIQDKATHLRLHQRAPEELLRKGWELWEYHAFMSFLFPDENIFPLNKLKSLESLGRPPNLTASEHVDALISGPNYNMPTFPLMWLIPLSLILYRRGGKRLHKTRALVFCYLGYIILLSYAYFYLAHYVPRIAIPTFLIATCGLMVFVKWREANHWPLVANTPDSARNPKFPERLRWFHPHVRRGIFIVGALGVLIWSGRNTHYYESLYRDWTSGAQYERFGDVIMNEVPQASSKHFFIFDALTGMAAGVDPLSADPLPFKSTVLNWCTFSPYFYDTLKTAGLEQGRDIFPSVLDREDLLFVGMDHRGKVLHAYARFRLGPTVRLTKLYDLSWPGISAFTLIRE